MNLLEDLLKRHKQNTREARNVLSLGNEEAMEFFLKSGQ